MAGRWWRHALVLLVGALCLSACGAPAPRSTPPGDLARDVDLSGQTFVVGGKEFEEQLILCKMTIAALESVGATVRDACATSGSANTRAGLSGGQIDMYWEYTGTAWRTYLGQQSAIDDPDRLFDAVRTADVGNGIAWLPRAPFDDSYGIGVSTEVADRLGVHRLSDLAALARTGGTDVSLCVAVEFAGREDGLVGLLRTYGFVLPPGRLSTLELPAIYPALAARTPCQFGEVGTTDGRLNALHLSVLADDRGYFLPYNGALTVRDQVLQRAPGLAEVGGRIAALLTDSTIRRLNERVTVEHVAPAVVARDFLREQHLTG